MLADTKAHSGLAGNDLQQAREFYGETLDVKTSEEYGLMWLHLAGGRDTLVHEQRDATRASYRPSSGCDSFCAREECQGKRFQASVLDHHHRRPQHQRGARDGSVK